VTLTSLKSSFLPTRLRERFRAVFSPRGPGEEAPLPAGARVNLGCGDAPLEGFVNIDARPDARADLRLDFRDLVTAFAPGALSEAVMLHSLAYLNLWQSRDLFKTIISLLAPGGRLIVETPDAEKCARRILASGGRRDEKALLEGVRGLFAFGQEHLREERDYAPYAFAWTGWHLKRELEAAGFTRVRVLEPRTHVAWRDVRVEARKPFAS
jgi:SAM-dependent methyltransferase